MKFVNLIYRYAQSYTDDKLAKFQLSSGTYAFLLFLNRKDGVSQNYISAELNVDKAMSARSIKKLIELGYVSKDVDEKDSRAFKLHITDRGREIVPEIIGIMEEWISFISEGSTEEEYKITVNFLRKALGKAKEYKKI